MSDLALERSSILLVDDDAILRDRMARALRERGHDVRTAASFDEAVAATKEESAELAVVDLKMPGRSGLELIGALKGIDPGTRVFVLTGFGSIATAVEAMKLGASHYLTKPVDVDELLAAFDRADDAVLPESGIPTPSLARTEWEHIQRVLSDCSGNISEAARRLGIHRRSLQRKLQKFPPSE